MFYYLRDTLHRNERWPVSKFPNRGMLSVVLPPDLAQYVCELGGKAWNTTPEPLEIAINLLAMWNGTSVTNRKTTTTFLLSRGCGKQDLSLSAR